MRSSSALFISIHEAPGDEIRLKRGTAGAKPRSICYMPSLLFGAWGHDGSVVLARAHADNDLASLKF